MTNQSAVESADCLFELGLEELPPKAMPALAAAFKQGMTKTLDGLGLGYESIEVFAAPRRLALLIRKLETRQADSQELLKGPPVRVAFDDAGEPTRAAIAFADKCGTTVQDLDREETDKGAWLVFEKSNTGLPFESLAQQILESAINDLPIPKRMRWGDSDESFVRPLHWLVALQGNTILPVTLFGIEAGNTSRGHRFHAPESFEISAPGEYREALRERFVVADFSERQQRVANSVHEVAESLDGMVQDDASLFEEIAALVDWPVAVGGAFDARFLALPAEVLESTLKVHQRYFPVYSKSGEAMPNFITVSNIESRDPDAVREGNQRVVTPRLADAEFFWNNDSKTPLSQRRGALDAIVYQKALGSIGDKTERVSALAAMLAEALGQDAQSTVTAAQLSRCDLVTDMVGEFPELQGIMGGYYASAENLSPEVVAAVRSFYQPRFAGDDIAEGDAGRLLAIADKLDSIAGIFAIGKRPTGNRDPFGLRRAALGVIRTLIEGGIDLDLPGAIRQAIQLQPVDVAEHPELAEDVYDFIIDRLRHYEMSSLCANQPDWFEAVAARAPHSLVDFHKRLVAVSKFVTLPAAESLAAANKRIANILRGAGTDANGEMTPETLTEPAEAALLKAWSSVSTEIAPLIGAREYERAMTALAGLREPVDQFFDDVMVMADDVEVRRNRLALLAAVRGLFLEVADVSELTVRAD